MVGLIFMHAAADVDVAKAVAREFNGGYFVRVPYGDWNSNICFGSWTVRVLHWTEAALIEGWESRLIQATAQSPAATIISIYGKPPLGHVSGAGASTIRLGERSDVAPVIAAANAVLLDMHNRQAAAFLARDSMG